MIINAMRISSVGGTNPLASGLSIKATGPTPETQAASQEKNSIYSNFEKEMSRRLNEAVQKSGHSNNNDNASADSSVLLQSLTGAMGEIGELFGREAATEVMANILTGTAQGVTEESLMSSIQNGLSSLKRLDANNMKMKELSEGFNKDLSLLLDPELADKKLENKQTMSLSYALVKHFGLEKAPEANPDEADTMEEGGAMENAAGNFNEKSYEMAGFNETGQWDTVTVTQLDERAAEEIREAAETGLNKVADLKMATVMKQEKGARIFNNLANFLEKNLQDKAASLFVNDCIMSSSLGPENSSPKMAEMLSQVYSKIAADGDADKLAAFENYINTDFKEAINPVLAAIQGGGGEALPPITEELGALQFKGITGASLAGESDAFSLNWGYEQDGSYDRAVSKRFLREDIRAVKAAEENAERAEQDRLAKAWDDTDEEKRIEAAKNKPKAKAGLPGLAEADKPAEAEADDLHSTLGEKFAEERRQSKLEEAMTTKFGQLSDSSRQALEQYVQDNFSEEEAEKLLEHTKWSNDLMSGLAAVHRDIRESGDSASKAEGFMKFLNGTLKKEVEAITEKLGGLGFEGWQAAPDGGLGELEAGFTFNGGETVKVLITGLGETLGESEEQLTADQLLKTSPASRPEEDTRDGQAALRASTKLLKLGTGYLIDLMA